MTINQAYILENASTGCAAFVACARGQHLAIRKFGDLNCVLTLLYLFCRLLQHSTISSSISYATEQTSTSLQVDTHLSWEANYFKNKTSIEL